MPPKEIIFRLVDSWGFLTNSMIASMLNISQPATFLHISSLLKSKNLRDLGRSSILKTSDNETVKGIFLSLGSRPFKSKSSLIPPPGGFKQRRIVTPNDFQNSEKWVKVKDGFIPSHNVWVSYASSLLHEYFYHIYGDENCPSYGKKPFKIESELDLRRRGWHSPRSQPIGGDPYLTSIPDMFISTPTVNFFVEMELTPKPVYRYESYLRLLPESQKIAWLFKDSETLDRVYKSIPLDDRGRMVFTTLNPKSIQSEIAKMFS